MLKKHERKQFLAEIQTLLLRAKRENNQELADEARKKVIDMAAHDGLFIFENVKPSE